MNLFNEAAKHYRNLRYIAADDDATERLELLEIIRLCQMEIQKNKGNGDAHVLLANAFSIASLSAGPLYHDSPAHAYLLTRACAVICHWALGAVWTRNKEIGARVLAQNREALAQWRGLAPSQAAAEMMRLHDMFYAEAVDPKSLPRIQEIFKVPERGTAL